MKSLKKILTFAAASALTLTMGAVALTGCGGGKDFTFEAEHATLAEPDGFVENPNWGIKAMDLETKQEGDNELVAIGYFSVKGMTITWKVNASEECDASIKICGSSTKFKKLIKADGTAVEYAPPTYQPNATPDEDVSGGIDELDAANCGVVLKVNGENAEMNGTLPGKEVTVKFVESMGIYALYVSGQYTANVKLQKGENTIVLEVDAQQGGGFNVDKIVVNTSAELTHTPVDNSDRMA